MCVLPALEKLFFSCVSDSGIWGVGQISGTGRTGIQLQHRYDARDVYSRVTLRFLKRVVLSSYNAEKWVSADGI
jgi:hypothetical protein